MLTSIILSLYDLPLHAAIPVGWRSSCCGGQIRNSPAKSCHVFLHQFNRHIRNSLHPHQPGRESDGVAFSASLLHPSAADVHMIRIK